MSGWPNKDSDGVIRISAQDAANPHVDDLLKRQMSLRGERGVARHRGKWYYQNWFVLGGAGLLAALAAWALIEPHFYDLPYFQGAIEDYQTDVSAPRRFESGGQALELDLHAQGRLVLKRGSQTETVYVLPGITKELHPDGEKALLRDETLQKGREVGVYVECLDAGSTLLSLCAFVIVDPPPARGAARSLRQVLAESHAAGLLLFPLVAGFIGLALGMADGVICRLPRRALLGGLVGLLVGFVGGFIFSFLANLAYMPLNHLAMAQSGAEHGLTTFGFIVQMTGRALGWTLAGVAMGLGQGIALRSRRLLLFGLLGGVLGGLLGGLLFDPLDLILLGTEKPSACWSRMAGIGLIGLSVGGMIGVVELLARDAWLRMLEGPLAGKEFLLFRDVMRIGASPRSDIYLFNDQRVAPEHALLRAVGDQCELETVDPVHTVLVNNSPTHRTRLRHGDQIRIGSTVFVFETRKG